MQIPPFPEQLHWSIWAICALLAFSFIGQLYFFLAYFIRLAIFKPATGSVWHYPPVSVVVCVRRNVENVKKLMEALLAQDYPRYEIIVVEDRSDEDVHNYLKELKSYHSKIYLAYIEETPNRFNEKKYALTLGIKAAQYEHILFTDDDCEPVSKNWIAEMQRPFTENVEIVLGYSPYKKERGLLNGLIRFETFYTALQYFSFALGGKPYMGVGRNLAYTKELFLNAKGFYKHIFIRGGDDDLFINRASNKKNTAIQISAESLVQSEPKRSFGAWFRQKRRHLSVGKYYKASDKVRLGILAFSWLSFWVASISLCFVPELWFWAGIVFVVRELMVGIIYTLAAKKLSEKLNVFQLLSLDFIYLFCYVYFGITALITRKITWD